MPDVFDEIAPDQETQQGDVFDQIAPEPAGDVFDQIAPEQPKAPDSGFLASAAASTASNVANAAAFVVEGPREEDPAAKSARLQKSIEDQRTALANVTKHTTEKGFSTAEDDALAKSIQRNLNRAQGALAEHSAMDAGEAARIRARNKEAESTLGTAARTVREFANEDIWNFYGADPKSENFGAQSGRGFGMALSSVPGMMGGLPAAVVQMSGSASEHARYEKEKELRAAGADQATIVAEGKKAGDEAFRGATAGLGVYMLSGRGAGAIAAKWAGPAASTLMKTLASFGGATAANVGTGAVLRALEAPEGQRLSAALPSVENLTADTLFAVFHAHGEYKTATKEAKAAAAEELRRRGFADEQINTDREEPATAPAVEVLTPEQKAARDAKSTAVDKLAEQARQDGLNATAAALEKQNTPEPIEPLPGGSVSGTAGPPIEEPIPPAPADIDTAAANHEAELAAGGNPFVPEIHRAEVDLLRGLKAPIPPEPAEVAPSTPAVQDNNASDLSAVEGPKEADSPPAVQSTETQVYGNQPIFLDPKRLKLSKDVPQFKHGADEKGVVEPLEGEFDETGTGPVQVWRRLNGDLEIISGRHRLDLAQRSNAPRMLAQVHDEALGFDQRAAARLDAELNIRDENGSTADYASYFRHSDVTESDAQSRGLLGRAKGRAGFSIARGASEDVFALHQSGKIGDAEAEAISDAAPGNESAQRLGLRARRDGASIQDAANAIRAAVAGFKGETAEQGDFFSDTALDEQWLSQGKVASQRQQAIRDDISAVRGAAKKPELARKYGVDVQDPAGVQKKIGELRAELNRWENWPQHPDLVAITRGEKAPLPKLRAGERQGDILSSQKEDLTLVGESADDGARIAADKAAAEKAAADAKAEQDKNQGNLFASKADKPLQDAYQRLVESDQFKFPAVSIGKLAAEAGLSLEAMKAKILDLWKQGKVVLSQGDWSLADEATRAGAVEAGGTRYLQVRPEGSQVLESKTPRSAESNLAGKVLEAAEKAPTAAELDAAGKQPSTVEFERPGGGKVVVQNTREALQSLADRFQPKRDGSRVQAIADAVEAIKSKVNGIRVRVLRNEADLPADVRKLVNPRDIHEGLADTRNGDVYIFADNISTPERALEVAAHEIIGHHGIERVVDPGEWGAIAKGIRERAPKAYEELSRKYGDDETTIAREYVARVAEKPLLDRPLWAKVVQAVRNGLRSMGIVREWSEADIRDLVRKGTKAIERPAPARGEGGLSAAVRDLGDEVDKRSPYAKHIEDAFKKAMPDEQSRAAIEEYVRAKLVKGETLKLSHAEQTVAEHFLTYFRAKEEFAKRNGVLEEAQARFEEAVKDKPNLDLSERLAVYSSEVNRTVADKVASRTPGQPISPDSPTSIRNAIVDRERAARGLPPAMEPSRKSFGAAWDEAMRVLDADHEASRRLVDDVLNPLRPDKAIDDWQDALLLHRQITLQNEFDAAGKRIVEAHESGDLAAVEETRLRAAQIEDELVRTYDAGKRAGTATGRGLNARKMMRENDFSLPNMIVRKRAGLGGRPLTAEEHAGVEQLRLRMDEAEKKIAPAEEKADLELATESATSELKDVVSKVKPRKAKAPAAANEAPKTSEAAAGWLQKQADAARERIKSRKGTLHADPLGVMTAIDLADRVIVGAADIASGIRDFTSWAAKQIREFGEGIKPHLDKIWNESNAMVRRQELIAKTADKARARIAKDKDIPKAKLRPYVRKIAEEIVAGGATEVPALLDELHPIVESLVPSITRRQTMDLFSGYGEFSPLSKEAIKVQLRDLSGQSQQIAKIEDMQAGEAPKKTGVQRREPSDKERALIREVENLKKKGGFKVTDPESQLKSAMGAVVTRLKNQIRDLTTRFEVGVKPPDRPPLQYSQEAEVLRAIRDNLRATVEAIEGKPGVTDEQRLAAATKAMERSIAEYERRLKEDDYASRSKRPRISSPELEAMKAQRDALKAEFEELRELDEQVSRQRAERREADLEEQIRVLDEKFKKGDFSTAGKKAAAEPTQRASDLAAERDAMRKELDERRRKENRVPLTDAEKEAAATRRSLAAYKTRTRQRIADLQTRLANKDFADRPARSRLILDDAAVKAKADLERLRHEFERELIKDKMAKRGTIERALEGAAKWRRAIILSGPVTIFKLASAAAEIVGIAPVEEAIGGAIGKIPGMSRISREAPRHGGFNGRAEAAAIVENLTKLFSDMGTYMKKGGLDIDELYGKPHLYPFELKEFFGRMHGALKTPARRNEFTRSFSKRMHFLENRGIDITDPAIQLRESMNAYKDANRSIFMEDNMVVDAYKRGLSAFTQNKKGTGRPSLRGKAAETFAKITLPVVRIPTNIVARTFEYTFGSVSGLGRIARVMRNGFDTLTPDEADAIMRNLKRGSLGGAVLALGFLNPNSVGGYYHGKRDEKDLKPGTLKIFGQEIPKALIHNPLLEQLQVGATMRRVMDSKIHHSKETEGMGAGAWAALMGVVEETPFAGAILRTSKAMVPHGQSEYFGELGKSLIPPGLNNAAAWLEKHENDSVEVKHSPKTAADRVKMAIPGLRETVPLKKKQPKTSVF